MTDAGEAPNLKELQYLWGHYVGAETVFKTEMRPQVKHLRKKESRIALDMYNAAVEEYARAKFPEFWSEGAR